MIIILYIDILRNLKTMTYYGIVCTNTLVYTFCTFHTIYNTMFTKPFHI